MILIEQTQVPDADLPVAEFREHLQLGSGFADDGFQDAVLVQHLRAALSVVEGKTSKALISRNFLLMMSAWRFLGEQALPIAPVASISSLSIVNANGDSDVLDVTSYRLRPDTHAPAIVSSGLSFPVIPVGGTADIAFSAGFGAWADVPADLCQAVMLVATQYYEARSAVGAQQALLPYGVAEICRRHAPMRVVGARRV